MQERMQAENVTYMEPHPAPAQQSSLLEARMGRAISLKEACKAESETLDNEITQLALARSELGATGSPGPVVNYNSIASVIIALLAVTGVVLTQEQAGAVEIVAAALVPVVINGFAALGARKKVTPVRGAK